MWRTNHKIGKGERQGRNKKRTFRKNRSSDPLNKRRLTLGGSSSRYPNQYFEGSRYSSQSFQDNDNYKGTRHRSYKSSLKPVSLDGEMGEIDESMDTDSTNDGDDALQSEEEEMDIDSINNGIVKKKATT